MQNFLVYIFLKKGSYVFKRVTSKLEIDSIKKPTEASLNHFKKSMRLKKTQFFKDPDNLFSGKFGHLNNKNDFIVGEYKLEW